LSNHIIRGPQHISSTVAVWVPVESVGIFIRGRDDGKMTAENKTVIPMETRPELDFQWYLSRFSLWLAGAPVSTGYLSVVQNHSDVDARNPTP
jgi:hypothetical protein